MPVICTVCMLLSIVDLLEKPSNLYLQVISLGKPHDVIEQFDILPHQIVYILIV